MTAPLQRSHPPGPASIHLPTAYDRFDSVRRNVWIDDLQRKIRNGLNKEDSPGPSRSPSPLRGLYSAGEQLELEDRAQIEAGQDGVDLDGFQHPDHVGEAAQILSEDRQLEASGLNEADIDAHPHAVFSGAYDTGYHEDQVAMQAMVDLGQDVHPESSQYLAAGEGIVNEVMDEENGYNQPLADPGGMRLEGEIGFVDDEDEYEEDLHRPELDDEERFHEAEVHEEDEVVYIGSSDEEESDEDEEAEERRDYDGEDEDEEQEEYDDEEDAEQDYDAQAGFAHRPEVDELGEADVNEEHPLGDEADEQTPSPVLPHVDPMLEPSYTQSSSSFYPPLPQAMDIQIDPNLEAAPMSQDDEWAGNSPIDIPAEMRELDSALLAELAQHIPDPASEFGLYPPLPQIDLPITQDEPERVATTSYTFAQEDLLPANDSDIVHAITQESTKDVVDIPSTSEAEQENSPLMSDEGQHAAEDDQMDAEPEESHVPLRDAVIDETMDAGDILSAMEQGQLVSEVQEGPRASESRIGTVTVEDEVEEEDERTPEPLDPAFAMPRMDDSALAADSSTAQSVIFEEIQIEEVEELDIPASGPGKYFSESATEDVGQVIEPTSTPATPGLRDPFQLSVVEIVEVEVEQAEDAKPAEDTTMPESEAALETEASQEPSRAPSEAPLPFGLAAFLPQTSQIPATLPSDHPTHPDSTDVISGSTSALADDTLTSMPDVPFVEHQQSQTAVAADLEPAVERPFVSEHDDEDVGMGEAEDDVDMSREASTSTFPDPHEPPKDSTSTMPVPFLFRTPVATPSPSPSLQVAASEGVPQPSSVIDNAEAIPREETPVDLPDPHEPPPDAIMASPMIPHRDRQSDSPSLMVEPPLNPPEPDSIPPPNPRTEKEETPTRLPDPKLPPEDATLPATLQAGEMFSLDSPTPSLVVEPPDNPPLPYTITTAVSRAETPTRFPDPQAPPPDADRETPMRPHHLLASTMTPSASVIVEPPADSPRGSLKGDESRRQSLGTGDGHEEPPSALTLNDEQIIQPDENVEPVVAVDDAEEPTAPIATRLRHHHGPRTSAVVPLVPPRQTLATKRAVTSSQEPAEPSVHVTRSHCFYRKLHLVEDDLTATVLVPQCTLSDPERLEEEESEDAGQPTAAEEAEAHPRVMSTQNPILVAEMVFKLHRIVGRAIFDEGHCYLLSADDDALAVNSSKDVDDEGEDAATEANEEEGEVQEEVKSDNDTETGTTEPSAPRRSDRKRQPKIEEDMVTFASLRKGKASTKPISSASAEAPSTIPTSPLTGHQRLTRSASRALSEHEGASVQTPPSRRRQLPRHSMSATLEEEIVSEVQDSPAAHTRSRETPRLEESPVIRRSSRNAPGPDSSPLQSSSSRRSQSITDSPALHTRSRETPALETPPMTSGAEDSPARHTRSRMTPVPSESPIQTRRSKTDALGLIADEEEDMDEIDSIPREDLNRPQTRSRTPKRAPSTSKDQSKRRVSARHKEDDPYRPDDDDIEDDADQDEGDDEDSSTETEKHKSAGKTKRGRRTKGNARASTSAEPSIKIEVKVEGEYAKGESSRVIGDDETDIVLDEEVVDNQEGSVVKRLSRRKSRRSLAAKQDTASFKLPKEEMYHSDPSDGETTPEPHAGRGRKRKDRASSSKIERELRAALKDAGADEDVDEEDPRDDEEESKVETRSMKRRAIEVDNHPVASPGIEAPSETPTEGKKGELEGTNDKPPVTPMTTRSSRPWFSNPFKRRR